MIPSDGWQSRYVGIPFKTGRADFDAADCWGLVKLAYQAELGLSLPHYFEEQDSAADPSATDEIVERCAGTWIPSDEPRRFDVLVFKIGKYRSHVCLVSRPGWMLNTRMGGRSSQERYESPLWRRLRVGCYRHASLME